MYIGDQDAQLHSACYLEFQIFARSGSALVDMYHMHQGTADVLVLHSICSLQSLHQATSDPHTLLLEAPGPVQEL